MPEQGLTILVVDDDEQFLESVAQRMRLRGHQVSTAASGAQALEAARGARLDLAVVDLRLPDMDGLVVITKLRELQPEVRTILLTAHGDDKVKEATESLSSAYFEKGRMAGFWEFLSGIPFRRVSILLVDDDEAFLGALAARIQIKGYEPLRALTGGQAIEIARQNRIHVAVVDMRLPDMDGLVVLTKLKEIHPDVAGILLTGHGGAKLKEATEALNSAYFAKEDMGSFWGFIRRVLRNLETTMAAAGMAQHGDVDDARRMGDKAEDGEEDKK